MEDEELENVDHVRIDKFSLDCEAEVQARLYRHWAGKLADANHQAALAKADLELVEAEQDKDARLFPQKHGIEKVTEGAIKNAVVLSKPYQEAKRALIEAEHLVDIFKADVRALDHKKSMIESEIQLFLSGYFAEPREPKGVPQYKLDKERMRTRREKSGK